MIRPGHVSIWVEHNVITIIATMRHIKNLTFNVEQDTQLYQSSYANIYPPLKR